MNQTRRQVPTLLSRVRFAFLSIILIASILGALPSPVQASPAAAQPYQAVNNPPNAPTLIAPSNGALAVTIPPTLSVQVSDPESSAMTVKFYGRPKINTSAPFSIVVLPDTQNYTLPANQPVGASIFSGQTTWVVNNQAARNIVYVANLGDITYNGDDDTDNSEWIIANAAYSILERGTPSDGSDDIPFNMTIGNHESYGGGSYTRYNTYFPVSRFSSRPYFGGSASSSTNVNNWGKFSAAGLDFMVISIDCSSDTNGSGVIYGTDWAKTVLAANPTRRAIVACHTLLSPNDTSSDPFNGSGQYVYDQLKVYPNLFLMLGGHDDTAGYRSETYNGNTVYAMRSDYQNYAPGGNGWLRILEFQPANNLIQVYTHSSYTNGDMTDALNQFSVPYSMPGPWQLLGTVSSVPSGGTANFIWSGLSNNTEYEWYVNVSDGTNSTNSSTWSFKTEIPTTTSVNCGSGTPSVTYGSSITCVATVTATVGTTSPTGMVGWASSGSGNFATSPCTLAGSGGTATCSVTYTPGAFGTGSHTITATYGGSGSFNSSNGNQAVTVNKKTLTPGITANNKIYDGTTAATIATRTLTGVVGSDDVTLTGGTATFADKNTGTGKAVTATGLSLGGSTSSNYLLSSSSAVTTANVTPAALSITASNASKTYDKLAYSGGNGVTYSGFVSGDNAGNALSGILTYSGTSQGAVNQGTYVITPGGLTANNGNYAITFSNGSLTINPAPLTISANNDSKTYNKLAYSGGNGVIYSGFISGDHAGSALSGTLAYSGSSQGAVNQGAYIITPGGLTAINGNYSITFGNGSLTINPVALTVDAIDASKNYDTLPYSGGNGVTYSGFITGDNESNAISGTLTYSGSSQGAVNHGTYVITPGGLTAINGNYTITFSNGDLNINPVPLAVTANNQSIIIHNPLPSVFTFQYSGFLTGDDENDLTTKPTCSSLTADKDTLGTYPITCSGGVATNYTFNYVDGTLYVTPAIGTTLIVNPTTGTYGGTVNLSATLTETVTGNPAAGVAVSFTLNGTLAGSGITNASGMATVSSVSLAGIDAGIYSTGSGASFAGNSKYIASSDIDSLTVNTASLVPFITVSNKVYEGTTAATITARNITGVLGSDAVSLTGGTATFSDKNVGNGKTVTGSGFSLAGADAGNYHLLPTTATTIANIGIRSLTVSATGVNKTYDGTTAATVSLSTNAPVGDSVTPAYSTATFTNKNAGTGRTINVSGISISGADAGNYSLSNTTAGTTANITPRDLTVSATGVNKVYDGTTAATVSLSTNKLAGDTVTAAYASASFVDKNVANGKTVNVSGISISGADVANYSLSNTAASTTANITKRNLTVSAVGVNRAYDGTMVAPVLLPTDSAAGDTVTPAYTAASFADKNVGNGKTVSVSGISISGADAGNYNLLNTTASTTANITPKGLTVSATGINKVYDGTTATIVTLSTDKLAGETVNTAYTSAAFADKNVGNGKTVTVSGISISGADVANYSLLNTTATATANITPLAIGVTADSGQSKTFGDPDPVFTYSVTSGSLFAGDAFSDALSRFAGESSGTYAITQGTLTAGSNYNLSFVGANFTILPPTSATFVDVPTDYWAWKWIDSIYHTGITGGCSTNPLSYCPANPVTRAQMAVFLLRGIHGGAYTPPAGTGTVFADVPSTYWAVAWIEQLASEGVTSGCGGGNYCPDNPVTRDQMAIFLLRSKHGSAYTPPAATGTLFTDVVASYWAASWIEQLAAEGVTAGCGGGNYCPLNPVTRDQMAVFIQRTFSLPLP